MDNKQTENMPVYINSLANIDRPRKKLHPPGATRAKNQCILPNYLT